MQWTRKIQLLEYCRVMNCSKVTIEDISKSGVEGLNTGAMFSVAMVKSRKCEDEIRKFEIICQKNQTRFIAIDFARRVCPCAPLTCLESFGASVSVRQPLGSRFERSPAVDWFYQVKRTFPYYHPVAGYC